MEGIFWLLHERLLNNNKLIRVFVKSFSHRIKYVEQRWTLRIDFQIPVFTQNGLNDFASRHISGRFCNPVVLGVTIPAIYLNYQSNQDIFRHKFLVYAEVLVSFYSYNCYFKKSMLGYNLFLMEDW